MASQVGSGCIIADPFSAIIFHFTFSVQLGTLNWQTSRRYYREHIINILHLNIQITSNFLAHFSVVPTTIKSLTCKYVQKVTCIIRWDKTRDDIKRL